jgi:hypothetical protein
MRKYEINDQILVIRESSSGEVIWQGRPLDCDVKKIKSLEKQVGCIVLLDYDDFVKSSYRYLSNLVNVDPEGKITWTAKLPESIDCFVDFICIDDKLFANSWSGFRLQIDIANGKTIDKVFTK